MKWARTTVAMIAANVLIGTTLAHWMFPQPAPVERLVKNLTKYTSEHPNDASGHYALARVHSMAYVLGYAELDTFGNRGKGDREDKPDAIGPRDIPSDESSPKPGPSLKPWREDGKAPRLTDAQRWGHLKDGVRSFERAIASPWESDSKWYKKLLDLSYAYMLEKGASDAARIDIIPGIDMEGEIDPAIRQKVLELVTAASTAPKDQAPARDTDLAKALQTHGAPAWRVLLEFRGDANECVRALVQRSLERYWKDRAIAFYLRAFRANIDHDLVDEDHMMSGPDAIKEMASHEAGIAFIRLIKERDMSDDDRESLREVERGIDRLKARNWSGGYITPIVFSFTDHASFAELLEPRAEVWFDLAGTGQPRTWPWLRPTTGILVWDPDGKGRITSGRQLFGSVTWWIMFPDGYRAMDALDDDRNGQLSGFELKGLAVWFDRNQNGVSDAGEVTPIERLGVASLATCGVTGTADDGRSLVHERGMTMTDGRVLPTYDWVVSPIVDRATPAPVYLEWSIVVAFAATWSGVFLFTSRHRP